METKANPLHKYEMLEKVGEGTYGVVYKARENDSKELVAIKKIRFQHEDEGIPSTAVREVSLLKGLKHPNIVLLKEVVYRNESLNLVFEYSENDLKKLMKKMTEPLGSLKVKSYTRQLMEGLAYCHKKRIIHRDLKPHNLLIDSSDRLQLADFGLARTFTLPIREYTHEVITLWYRSPEILLGQKIYSTPADIWSAGCIFAEMLLGAPFIPGDSEIDQIFKIFRVLGTPTDKTWPGFSQLPDYKPSFPRFKKESFAEIFLDCCPQAINLLEKMLVLDPDRRLTAEEVLHHPYFH
jgi:serine/threonine protein kinase